MIYRNQNKGYLAGVSAGIAEAYDIPVSLVRSLFILTSFILGLGVFAYMYLTLIMAERDGQTHLNFR